MKGLTLSMIGSLGYTPYKSELVKKFTSCKIDWDDLFLQIDIGNKFEGKLVNYLLISHLHYDHVQEFRSCPRSTKVLVPSGTFIEPLRRKNPYVDIQVIKSEFDLGGGLTVKPFPVLHSSTTLTYGFKFEWKNYSMVWISDYCIIPTFAHLINNIDYLFIGAAAMRRAIEHKGMGHCQAPIYETLQKIMELKIPPRKIFLIHFGMGMGPIPLKTKYLRKQFPDLDISWTYDTKKVQL
jgi:phosphoribosyl 1,2-cyclic phosphodiesterase